MIGKFIIWILQKIYIRRIRKLFGKQRIVAVRGLLANYATTENKEEAYKNRALYVKELKSLDIITEEFATETLKVMNSISSHMSIHNEVYLLHLLVVTSLRDSFDMRQTKHKENFDEMMSNLDYLIFNFKI